MINSLRPRRRLIDAYETVKLAGALTQSNGEDTVRRFQTINGKWILVLLLAEGCGYLEEYPDPESVFEATFNTPPGPNISSLQAYGRGFRDNSYCYLRFKISSADFSSLTANGFTPISKKEYQDETKGSITGPIPTWWNPIQDSPTVFLHSTSFHPTFSQGRAIVAYSPKTRIVNFYWDGID